MIKQRLESMELGFELDLSGIEKLGFLERGRREIDEEKWREMRDRA